MDITSKDSQEENIKKSISKEVGESVKSALSKFWKECNKKGRILEEDQFWSLSDDEEYEETGPGGKCLEKRKHLGEEDFERGCPLIKNKLVSGVLRGTMERQVNPARDMAGESSRKNMEYSDEYDEHILDMNDENDLDEFDVLEGKETGKKRQVQNPLGHTLFEPSDVKHPRSAEWWPMHHVAEYLRQKNLKPLKRNKRDIMMAECSRPVIGEKDSMTPNLDPDLTTYLFKLGRDPHKGLERSVKQC
ncbi:hypothetical protein NDU88_008390 [Pleurodeles waltl]|uniref:Uncharacterized protein n=1 Tax=Pleurodeles waltl TaxID=8319 RepID=A0AAV7RS74_PLEWA|nr:hypothetical protein NDU88_008390 [Pleurodeles waltl]